MNNILLYFLKSAIAMAMFYGIYRLFLERDTNYSLNRFYLAGTLLLSICLPIFPLESLFEVNRYAVPSFFIAGELDAGIGIEAVASSGPAVQLDGTLLLKIIYIGGIVLLLSTLLFQLSRLLLMNKVESEEYGPLKIFFVNKEILPFSILNRVFINKESRKDPKISTILAHEYAHFRLMHFIDLLLIEFVTIFQWFNPFAWLYVRSLKEVHEFQADAAVLNAGEVTGTYQALLVNQLTGTEVFRLSSGFSMSLTKKRMIMMTKMKSKKNAWLKIFLAMPVLAILVIAYAAKLPNLETETSGSAGKDYVVKGKVLYDETGDPLPGVAVIWKGTTAGTVTDKEGEFILHVQDKDAVVVYSFVGLQTATTRGEGSFTVRMKKNVIAVTDPPARENIPGPTDPSKTSPEPERKIKMREDQVFYVVEEMPKFQGEDFRACKPWLKENVKLPKEAKEKGLKGDVFVEFVVGSDGNVKDARIVRSIDPTLDKAALEAVNSMPAWTPGSQRGKAVKVAFTVPVEF